VQWLLFITSHLYYLPGAQWKIFRQCAQVSRHPQARLRIAEVRQYFYHTRHFKQTDTEAQQPSDQDCQKKTIDIKSEHVSSVDDRNSPSEHF